MKVKKHVPNALTLLRFPLAGLTAGLIFNGHNQWAFAPFAVSALSDLLDGWLARRWGVESRFGRVADPIADIAFLAPGSYLLWNFLPLELFAVFFISKTAVMATSGWIYLRKIEAAWPNTLGRVSYGFIIVSASMVMLWGGTSAWPVFYGLAVAALAGGVMMRLLSFRTLARAISRLD